MQSFDQDIVRRIRERSADMERRGELDDWLLEKIYDEKLFKLFVPSELNGLGSSLPEALRAFERMSWIDGSLGWLVTIGSGGGFFAAALPERRAAELFSGRKAVLAGSGMPTGKARKVEGGYRVTGSWAYCSGATFATFFTANCKIEGTGEELVRSFAFLPRQVQIAKDWNPLGLRATASHSIEVRDAYVPEDMTFDLTAEPRLDDPIYRYSFLAFAQTSFAAASVGVGRHFLEECAEFAASKAPEWKETSPRRMAALESAVAERLGILEAASNRFYELAESSWDTFVREGTLPEEVWREIGRRSQEAAAAARSGSDAVFPLLGMTALRHDHALCRTWRDLHTVTQHSVLLPENEE